MLLAQGTLRPDLIESASSIASKHADAIKTHHNDTELVRILREEGRVIEPLRDFHKDEVRQLGRDLGLPEKIVERHPFPGMCKCYSAHDLIMHLFQAPVLPFAYCVHVSHSSAITSRKHTPNYA